MLLHGMNDCKGSRPAYKPDGSCVLDVSLRKNLRAVDPTLLCGAETFSLNAFEHGWNGILVAGSRLPPGNEPSFWCTVRCNAGHRMDYLFPTLGCWQSVCPCRRKDDLSLKFGCGKIDPTHNVALATQSSHKSLIRKP